jgi:hypothetical protein
VRREGEREKRKKKRSGERNFPTFDGTLVIW